jgi:hypothetical protein
VDLHPLAEVMMTHLESGADKFRNLFIGCIEHSLHLIHFQELSLKRFISEFAKIHSSLRCGNF